MGIFGSTPSAPKPPPLPPAPAPVPVLSDTVAQAARTKASALGALTGTNSTILTSGVGLDEPASTTRKTLLGQ